MKNHKPKRRIHKNYELRRELIEKGYVVPVRLVPLWLKKKGFLAAAEVAEDRLRHGLPLYRR